MKTLRRFVWLIAPAAFLGFAISSHGSPYCCEGEKSAPLAQQFDDAVIVMYGHFENAKPGGGGVERGHTDFVIEKVFKDHDMIKGKNSIRLPQYITDSKSKFIVFCDVYKGKLDAYKGTQLVDGGEMLKYLDGVMKNRQKSQPERLLFAFDYLQSPEIEVSMDAYREFARADYRDYKDIAKKLPADTLAGWLKDPKTPSYRYGLYATLLGHCGNAKHAEFLMEMINDETRRKSSGLHGFMMAYTMMEPGKGWKFIKSLVQDKDQPFLVRYSGLQTIRFLYEARPDIVSKDETGARKEIITGVLGILDAVDMADFAVEDLRKWKRWETCDHILKLFEHKDYNRPIIRKSILRYALQCPTDTAKRFVKGQRARDKDWVEETEELLNLETTPAPVTPTTK